jgi:hypothetical protein
LFLRIVELLSIKKYERPIQPRRDIADLLAMPGWAVIEFDLQRKDAAPNCPYLTGAMNVMQ